MAASPRARRQPRLAIVGLDGATWDIINPLMEAGKLPNLQQLVAEGSSGSLQSVIPPVTAPAWATMLTGCDPGEHGVFAMTIQDPESGRFRPVTMNDWRARPLWSIANDCGLTAGFMGVPFAYPPQSVDGYMISGIMGTPRYDERMFNPSSLFAPVTAAAGTYPLDSPSKVRGTAPFEVLRRQTEWIRDATTHLLRHSPVDLFMVVENYTDHVGHSYLRERRYDCDGEMIDLIEHAYRAADELIGRVRDAVGEDCPILVVSDHGMGLFEGYINLERALGVEAPVARRSFLRQVWRALVKLMPASVVRRLRREYWERPKAGRIVPYGDTTLTLTGVEGAIRVNADDHECRSHIIDEIVERLASIEDPATGAPLIEPKRGSEQYAGPHVDRGPDVIAWPANQGHQHFLHAPKWVPLLPTKEETKRAGMALAQLDPEGCHRLDGVALANAPAVAAGEAAHAAFPQHLRDVMAYVLGICFGEDLPDEAKIGPMTPDETGDVYESDEQELIEERLADLGYL